MIYRVEVSPWVFFNRLQTGRVFPRTQVTRGLPQGARLFHVCPNRNGNWDLLFEGRPENGPDVEGATQDIRIQFTSIEGDAPLPIPETIDDMSGLFIDLMRVKP